MAQSKKEYYEVDILNKIVILPDDIIDIIYSYISYKVKIFLNKNLYVQNHYVLQKYIIKGSMENYIRDVLRRDNEFVFTQILNENYSKWIFNLKKYNYKNTIYNNYLSFVTDFCLMNGSTKCRNIINDFLQKHELCKNQHKKNPVRNIRWRN